jgi:septum site-determining protein MinC
MVVATASNTSQASGTFELKSAALTLVAVVLKTTDLALLANEMEARFGDAPGLFDQDPVAIDLSFVNDAPEPIDFASIVGLLRGYKMHPIAAKGGNAQQMEDALAAGLVEAQGQSAPSARKPSLTVEPREVERPVEVADVADAGVAGVVVADGVGNGGDGGGGGNGDGGGVDSNAAQQSGLEVDVDVSFATRPTLIIDKPLRSGQRIYAKGSDLVVLAVVSFGAEVIADGNIHVYAPLRGRAAAGALGDTSARIFTTCMEPQLISIAGNYRTTETELPVEVRGKPAQVRLDGERLVVEALKY